MQYSEIQERILKLKKEIEELRAASERYHSVNRHSTLEMNAQLHRELRVQELVNELASLSKRKPL